MQLKKGKEVTEKVENFEDLLSDKKEKKKNRKVSDKQGWTLKMEDDKEIDFEQVIAEEKKK